VGMKILITGASGFVGGGLCAYMRQQSRDIRIALRSFELNSKCHEAVSVGEIDGHTDWEPALRDVNIVIHLAARVHAIGEKCSDDLFGYRQVNVVGTLNLARQASLSGVKRFIFISSIKVNGAFSRPGKPFSADQIPTPIDPYAVSKYEAEKELLELASETGMEVVIIRPPLIYGPGVKANFAAMMRYLYFGIPLPFGGINNNQRSFVFLDNLIDLISICISHPAATNQIFLVSDDEDLSTLSLLNGMAKALGKPARLFSLPSSFISIAANFLGNPEMAQPLCTSLQADINKTKTLLGWSPPVSLKEGFRLTALSWLESRSL
jgi:nucleoside-diphosphate-sugar epimerase